MEGGAPEVRKALETFETDITSPGEMANGPSFAPYSLNFWEGDFYRRDALARVATQTAIEIEDVDSATPAIKLEPITPVKDRNSFVMDGMIDTQKARLDELISAGTDTAVHKLITVVIFKLARRFNPDLSTPGACRMYTGKVAT